MKLQLIARPGYAPTAIAFLEDCKRRGRMDRFMERQALAWRLLGPRASHDMTLSTRWHADVYCVPEFGKWWRTQANPPPREYRIFLEVLG